MTGQTAANLFNYIIRVDTCNQEELWIKLMLTDG